MKRKGILFVISAPSGAGKTSICSEVVDRMPHLRQSISYTTRPKREGEQDGVDYHFISREQFDQMVHDEAFAEWADVHGNSYGTAKATLQKAQDDGADVLLDIDFQGAAQLRQSGLDGVFLFIMPPSMRELERRLINRDTDSDAVIKRRMQNASNEIAQAVHFDYVVVNDQLPRAVETVMAIMRAESARTRRAIETLPDEFGLKSST
jgi:guanylate kinase